MNCISTLPTNLCIRCTVQPPGGYEIWSLKEIPIMTRFGPYSDELLEQHIDGDFLWKLEAKEKKIISLDGWNERISNWLRYINYAENKEEQNLIAIQLNSEVYYVTCKLIPANTKLRVWYEDMVSEDISIRMKGSGLDIQQSVQNPKKTAFKNDTQNEKEYSSRAEMKGNIYREHFQSEIVTGDLDVTINEGKSYQNKNYQLAKTEITNFVELKGTVIQQNRHGDSIAHHNVVVTNKIKNNEEENHGKACQIHESDTYKTKLLYHKRGKFDRNGLFVTSIETGRQKWKRDNGSSQLNEKCIVQKNNSIQIKIDGIKNLKTNEMRNESIAEVNASQLSADSGELKNESQIYEKKIIQKAKETISGKEIVAGKCYERGYGSNRFKKKHELTSHERIHTRKKPFKCNFCEKAFTQRGYLIKHNKLHIREKSFKCRFCGKAFKEKWLVINHQRIHTGEKPFKCSFCGKAFAERGNLATHERIHTRKKPFKCSFCRKAFTQRINLTNHERIHTRKKPFKCRFCDKAFTEKGSLTNHERIHTGKKPFKCSLCGKAFTQRINLTNHERTHTGEKPFKCSFCGKAFTERGNLKKHKRIHTGEKPFKCNFCEKAFTERGNLIKHKRMHTYRGEAI